MSHVKGRYVVVDGDDLYPSARERDNLCNDCGIRIWTRDMSIHDAWHERLANGEPDER